MMKAIVATVLVTGVVNAAPVILASQNQSLFRVNGGGTVEQFGMPAAISGLHVVDSRVFGSDTNGNYYEILSPAVGTPMAVQIAVLPRPFSSTTRIGNNIFGTHMPNQSLYRVDVTDLSNPVETLVGAYNRAFNGIAFDSTTGTAYAASSTTDALYRINLANASNTLIGGFGTDAGRLGLEWFDNQLYMAHQSRSSDRFELGTIDPTTGQYTLLMDLGPEVQGAETALAIIPEPAGFSLVLLGGLAAWRGRRA